MLTTPGYRQRGAAAVEFHIVALLALLPLCMGMLQMALLLIANHQVDFAVFAAARAGATGGAEPRIVQRALAEALVPLFVSSGGGVDRANLAQRVLEARVESLAEVAAFARIQLLAPAADAQADFSIERAGRRVIPNDSLQHRPMQVGRRSGITLQEANVLTISVTYCQPLIVPFARQLLVGVLRRLDPEPWNQRCYLSGRLPLSSRGVAPMQSDFLVR